MYETYIKRLSEDGAELIISEACGGVVESNKTTGANKYLPMNILGYIEKCLETTVFKMEICRYKL